TGHALAVRRDEGLDGELLGTLGLLRAERRRRDEQVGAALVVLRRVVVPVVEVRDDLARERGDGLAVPEHADLDLDTRDELLDEHLLVAGARAPDRRGQ